MVIVHLVDGTLDDIASAYRMIRDELALYGHGLSEKREILCLNKIDAIEPGAVEAKRRALQRAAGRDTPVLALSGVTGAGKPEVLDTILAALSLPRDDFVESGEESESAPVRRFPLPL